MLSRATERFQPYALAVLRVAIAFMFIQHGLQKFGFFEGRMREFPDLLWFAAVIEVAGSPFIALGLFTRPVAFLLCGQMAVAFFRSHLPAGFWPILNRGEPAFLFCFIYLFIFFAGPGKWSLDRWLEGKLGKRWWM